MVMGSVMTPPRSRMTSRCEHCLPHSVMSRKASRRGAHYGLILSAGAARARSKLSSTFFARIGQPRGWGSGPEISALLDDLVSPEQDPARDRELKRLGRSEVHHGVELLRLLHRNVGRLRALEDAIRVACRPLPYVGEVDAEAEQAAEVREFAEADAREPLPLGEGRQPARLGDEERIFIDRHGVGARALDLAEGPLEVLRAPRRDLHDLESYRASRFGHCLERDHVTLVLVVQEHGDALETR